MFDLSGDLFYDPAFPVSEVELAKQRFEDEQRKKREEQSRRSNLRKESTDSVDVSDASA